MSIAITGATGLLGGHLVEKFRAEGIAPTAVHRPGTKPHFSPDVITRPADVLDQVSLEEALEGATTVIHAAAFVSFNPRQQKKIYEINVEGTKHVVDTCLHLGIKNLIYISSVAALGRKSGEVLNEESKWMGVRSSDYAESKYLAELEVFRGAEEGLTVSLVNPAVILSAAQPARSSATLFDYVWNENHFYTNGLLNYVDARDVAEVVFQLFNKPQAGEKFILATGNITYKEFFLRVASHLGKSAPSIRISSSLSYWAGWAEEVRAVLLQREPIVTRQSAKMALQSYRYDPGKVKACLGIQFRSLDDTLAWCCEDFLRNVKPNK